MKRVKKNKSKIMNKAVPEYTVLIAGKAGAGIDKAGLIIGRILGLLGYYVYIYRDYPSIIRGGHTFSIVRASRSKIFAHKSKVSFLLALNQDALDIHGAKLTENSVLVYDSDTVNPRGLLANVKTSGVRIEKIIKEENAVEIMRNACIIGSFVKVAGIEWPAAEEIFKKELGKDLEMNLKVAGRGFNEAVQVLNIERAGKNILPILTGNEALSLGLVKAGLKAYLAYPMTPSSGILHFMANRAHEFGLVVIHPESEISVILMALGFSYAGKKTAIGTSGGGFCLMTEGLSLSGMAELPVVIIVGQRPGPSTGLPTYTAQTELNFVINAGQGEFTRLVVAPADPEQAYFWAGISLNLSWKYQLPAIILTDKTLAEGGSSFDMDLAGKIEEESVSLWDKQNVYNRYQITKTGVSKLAFPSESGAVIKVNSYEHDESGLTSEDPEITVAMQAKRLNKEGYLAKELDKYTTVKVYGKADSSRALLCWGSNAPVCAEVAESLGLRVVQPLVLCPFPVKRFKVAIAGAKDLICVENNATAQMARLIGQYGFKVNKNILRFDGRPFTVDELKEEVIKLIKPRKIRRGK